MNGLFETGKIKKHATQFKLFAGPDRNDLFDGGAPFAQGSLFADQAKAIEKAAELEEIERAKDLLAPRPFAYQATVEISMKDAGPDAEKYHISEEELNIHRELTHLIAKTKKKALVDMRIKVMDPRRTPYTIYEEIEIRIVGAYKQMTPAEARKYLRTHLGIYDIS